MTKKNFTIQKMAAVGLLSALVFIFSGVRIQFGEVAAVHLGNGFCALAGLLFGPGVGGLASGIGSMLYDFTNPAYIAESWITFLTKFALGLDVYKRQSGRRPRSHPRADAPGWRPPCLRGKIPRTHRPLHPKI